MIEEHILSEDNESRFNRNLGTTCLAHAFVVCRCDDETALSDLVRLVEVTPFMEHELSGFIEEMGLHPPTAARKRLLRAAIAKCELSSPL